jgi:2-iminobutanoate/2-iminopropanoate deaminase
VTKSVVRTENAPAPFQGAPYSQAIRAGDFVFVSGQLGLDPVTGSLVAGGAAEQAEQIMRNVGSILVAAGTSLEHLVKTSIFLADLGDFQAVNEVYGRHVGSDPPARSTFQVAGLPAGARIEIEAVAHVS